MQTQPTIRRALISVSDKKGIVEFATQLSQWNIEILATGGTAKLLQKHHIAITEVSDYTGFPEIMQGRIKTLHPKIHAGLLARRGIDDAVLQQHDIAPIDLVVVNLYPFAETLKKPGCSLAEAIENIDIGGPTMLRSAAKNYAAVTAIVDPNDYAIVLSEMQQQKQCTSLTLRQRLTQKVFAHTACYDRAIADYFAQQNNAESTLFPACYQPQFQRQKILRYGENPHQQAACYTNENCDRDTLASATLLQGKELSYNNMIDADCALQAVQELTPNRAGCVIVKHATPCGVAEANNLLDAYRKAYQCDAESAFGGIIAVNQTLTEALATQILQQQFVEVILAPDVTTEAKNLIAKKPNIRLLQYAVPEAAKNSILALRSISGGLLVQEQDMQRLQLKDCTVVSKRQPTETEWQDLLFAWQVTKFVRSNAIVFVKEGMTLGIGGGQTSRVFAAKIAVLRAELAGLPLKNAVMASDAFFPFADSIEFAAQHSISAIIQPGGSKRDAEVIAAADAANISMIFTGIRHFRH